MSDGQDLWEAPTGAVWNAIEIQLRTLARSVEATRRNVEMLTEIIGQLNPEPHFEVCDCGEAVWVKDGVVWDIDLSENRRHTCQPADTHSVRA